MARTAFSGLFGGSCELDVLCLMRRAEDADSKQARAFPTSTASIAAAAQQEGKNALKKMFGGVAGGLGLDVAVDPRLAKARKRETDKREIIGILQEYATDGFSEDEVNKGWSLLTSKGYFKEAEEFRKMYKELQSKSDLSYKHKVLSQRKLEYELDKKNILKSTREVGEYVDSEGKVFSKFINLYKDATSGSVLVPLGNDSDKPVGKVRLKSLLSINEKREIETNKQIAIRNTATYKEGLSRETARIQQGLDIGKDKAKMYADWAITNQKQTLEASNVAQRAIRKVEHMLTYIRELKAAGGKQGAVRAALNKVGRAFNIEAKEKGRFRIKARLLLIQDLRKLMGARPTDIDLKKMEEAYPGEEQPIETNEAILEEILSRYREEIFGGNFYRENPQGTPADFSRAVRKRFTEMGSYNTPLEVPQGKNFDKWYDGLPTGAIVRTPDGRIASRK